jgi:hypothetical protein
VRWWVRPCSRIVIVPSTTNNVAHMQRVRSNTYALLGHKFADAAIGDHVCELLDDHALAARVARVELDRLVTVQVSVHTIRTQTHVAHLAT